MAGTDIMHIAVAPVDNLEDSLISRVAVILGKDLYGTRLLLASKIPKVIAHYETREKAEAIARSFSELGLKPVVFADSELRRYSETYRPYSAELNRGEIIFSDHNDNKTVLKPEDAFLILKGIIHTSREMVTDTKKIKVDVPLTVMTGGIPIVRKVKDTKTTVLNREEYFIRIYKRDTADSHIEILQNDFDYSCLGEKMSLSSLSNFNLLLTRIIAIFPDMIFDDRLTKYSNPSVLSNTLNNVEVNCRLIHTFYIL
ncbi:MAG: hypothetical protein JW967_07460 [Dehalococcoidales bacterium]|nr:hypothetical protein [Dehalococcoidales bacterium]